MKRSLNFLIFSLFNLLIFSVQASWYWPFGHDEDSTNAPPRLHRLLEKANDYIELAEDESLNGNADKAIENYRLALGELDRVEAENPDRAEKPEFAPLRNRRAVCTAAIDAIRFAQVNENERPVAVSDTTELQKKWNKKHGIKNPEDEVDSLLNEETSSETSVTNAPASTAADAAPTNVVPVAVATNSVRVEASTNMAPVAASAKPVEAVDAQPPTKKPSRKDAPLPSAWQDRFRRAVEQVRNKDYAAADILLESLLRERPNDLNALLLRAAAQSGTGNNYAAQRTLEKAMRTHPRSYLPYYNLAYLALSLGEDVEVARQYYELGRTVGGPINAALERKLKEASK